MAEQEKRPLWKGATEFLLKAHIVAGAALLAFGIITTTLSAELLGGVGIAEGVVGRKILNSHGKGKR